MRAHWHIRRFTKEDCQEAIRLIDEVLQREPNNTLALSDLAYNLHFAGHLGWVDSPEEALARMGEAGRRAVACDDRDAAAHTTLALYELFHARRNNDAIGRLHRAIESIRTRASRTATWASRTHSAGKASRRFDNWKMPCA